MIESRNYCAKFQLKVRIQLQSNLKSVVELKFLKGYEQRISDYRKFVYLHKSGEKIKGNLRKSVNRITKVPKCLRIMFVLLSIHWMI